MNFRFLHAADIHLDSPLRKLSAYEGAPVERLRGATREAFVRLIDLAVAEKVDFVVLAGDLYDGDWRDFNTPLFFARQMGRLAEARIPVFLLDGNHDAANVMSRQLPLPGNVRKFSSERAETFLLKRLRVALHGRSFRDRETRQNLVRDYPEPVAGWFNIGVLHTSLEGDSGHASYAPCSVAHLEARDYDYWALGHVHTPRVVSERPWIVYPGNPQGRHIRETGERGCVLVAVSGGEVRVERRATDVLRWHRLEVDAGGVESFDQATERASFELRRLLEERSGGLPAAVRVEFVGRSPAHAELLRREAQAREELQNEAVILGDDLLWIEKLEIRTAPPLDDERLARADAVADLRRIFNEASGDEAFVAGLRAELDKLLSTADREVRGAEELETARAQSLDQLIAEAASLLAARLEGEWS